MCITKESLKEKIREEFWEDESEFSVEYFDVEVNMPIGDILEAYAELQYELNGDVVAYPDVKGNYTGNCKAFLESCNGKPGYTRKYDDNLLDFTF